MLGDIVIRLAAFAILGFLFLVLMGLWDRYERDTAALGFSGIYERYLAYQAGFAGDPQGYRAAFVGDASGLAALEE
jgi:hypothetical protein